MVESDSSIFHHSPLLYFYLVLVVKFCVVEDLLGVAAVVYNISLQRFAIEWTKIALCFIKPLFSDWIW